MAVIHFYQILVEILLLVIIKTQAESAIPTPLCQRSGGGKLRHLWGDAFDNTECTGPNGMQYPTSAIDSVVKSYRGSLRIGRAMPDPYFVRDKLLRAWLKANDVNGDIGRTTRSLNATSTRRTSCQSPGGRLCRTTFNTTAPLYGVSLTSGEPVTIVQKFPDLLQQVIFETCTSKECDVIHGKCTQTYVPYLFLVVPLGPVTLTGQDYVMVESGCVCKPKYSTET